jgi:hypothetical protein
MRRTTAVQLLTGCFVAAACAAPRTVMPVQPGPGGTVPIESSRSLHAVAGGAASRVPAASDFGWYPVKEGMPFLIHPISGDPDHAGPVRYYVKALTYGSLGAHRHTADMRITVLTGTQFILMGNLETARV